MQSNITTQCESQMRGYTMQDKHTVRIEREPSEKVLHEMKLALQDGLTKGKPSKECFRAAYYAVVNHGSVKQ